MRYGPLSLLAALALTLGLATTAFAQVAPEFKLGFKLLADQIPEVVGQPLEDEHHNVENGDGLQATSNGLMVWRKADNWTAFTDGHRTWINGPLGLQERLNTERFVWEPDAPAEYPAGRTIDLFNVAGQQGYAYSAPRMSPPVVILEEILDTPVRYNVDHTVYGINSVASSIPDGYTLGYLSLPQAISSYLRPLPGTRYTRADFQPVAMESIEPLAMAVPAGSPYQTVQQLIDAVRANPGGVKVRTGSDLSDLALAELQGMAGVQFAVERDPSGEVDVELQLVSKLLPGVAEGRLRTLAVLDGEEDPALPGVPTLSSQGYDIRLGQAWGYAVRARTAPHIVEALSATIGELLRRPDYLAEFEARVAPSGQRLRYMGSAEFTAYWDDLDARLQTVLSGQG